MTRSVVTQSSENYRQQRYNMDEWLIAHPDFLVQHGYESVTASEMTELRAAMCLLIKKPLALQEPGVRSRLEYMRRRYEGLARLYHHAKVGDRLNMSVNELEMLYRGSALQKARYAELIETYDEIVRHQSVRMVSSHPWPRRLALGVVIILSCLVLFLLDH